MSDKPIDDDGPRPAHQSTLNKLHYDLADALATELKAAVKSDDSKGKAALYNVIRQFLKENGIDKDTVPLANKKKVKTLQANFDFEDEVEDIRVGNC